MSDEIRKYWIETIQQLADDPNEFDNEGGDVMFVRGGREIQLTLRERPGIGISVARTLEGQTDYVPLPVYIQRDILALDRLALQIQKTIDRIAQKRSSKYIDGPAKIEVDKSFIETSSSSTDLAQLLNDNEPGVTNLIQLMAPAGHGKTVLLEEITQDFSRRYRPESAPFPIILLVDLLGRFVGNIDDAIAGAINNTYSFPSLTQRDVVIAMKNRWLMLALDGFDELVARIGPRNAFLRISDLLDQVGGGGSIIISARESFFELHRITVAIQSYLRPNRGSYKTSIVRLKPWTLTQGIEIFRQLGSTNPQQDLDGLLAAFDDDLIAFQPFFLTRLGELWRKGERFQDEHTLGSPLLRIRYVIERLLEREVSEKWLDAKGKPILSSQDHERMLSTIAEEMYRTGAFFLRLDEVKLTARFALEEAKLPSATIADAVERFPTHAFLQSTERGFRFSHDKFLHFFLGIRLAALCREAPDEFLKASDGKELMPEVVDWIVADLPQESSKRIEIVSRLLGSIRENAGIELLMNVACLVPRLIHGIVCADQIVLTGLVFSGEFLSEIELRGVVFKKCKFNAADLAGMRLIDCTISDSVFDDISISDTTSFQNTVFERCSFKIMHLKEKDRSFYSPREITERISLRGGRVADEVLLKEHVLADDIPADTIEVVERLVKVSNKGCDVCVEEFEERWGDIGRSVIESALAAGILRSWNRDAGGPRKHFVRFQKDRNGLLTSLQERIVDPEFKTFWQSLMHKK